MKAALHRPVVLIGLAVAPWIALAEGPEAVPAPPPPAQPQLESGPPPSPESGRMADLVPDLDPGRGTPATKAAELPEWTKSLPQEQEPEFKPAEGPQQAPPLRFTEEELAKIQKEKNWLVEEWKAHQEKRAQLEAELASNKEQSLIDDILKGYEEESGDGTPSGNPKAAEPGSLASLAPALDPADWKGSAELDLQKPLDRNTDANSLFDSPETPPLENPFAPPAPPDASTTFISPQSPLLTEKSPESSGLPAARLQLQPPPAADPALKLNPGNPDPTKPFEPAIGGIGPAPATAPGSAPDFIGPDQWPTRRQDPNQTQSNQDRIAWMMRQEQERRREEQSNRPTPKDLDPLQKSVRSPSRFN